jgi:hypothetical protein
MIRMVLSKLVAYLVTTGLAASSMLSVGAAHALYVQASVNGFVHLVSVTRCTSSRSVSRTLSPKVVTEVCPIRFGLVFVS